MNYFKIESTTISISINYSGTFKKNITISVGCINDSKKSRVVEMWPQVGLFVQFKG